MDGALFLFRFDFPSHENASGRKDSFQEALTDYLDAQELSYVLSALGGDRLSTGIVYREGGAVTLDDRQAVGEWAMLQPVKCTAYFGEIEIGHLDFDYMRPVDDWVFAIDNRSNEDVAEAEAYAQRISEMIKAFNERTGQRRDSH